MVDLPSAPDRIVTSVAPQSSVSRGDIISNANQTAGAVAAVADTLMDVATRQAKEQAAEDLKNQKIERDADGNITVANPANSIIFGRAGDAYHAAIAAGTAAQHGNVISQTLNDLHQKYPTSPDLFMEAADTFRTKYLQQHGSGVVGEAIARDFDQTKTQHYNSIANTAANIDLKQQDSALSANQSSARSDVLAAVRGGASLEDPGLQTKIAQFDRTTEQRALNPLFGYSQEQAKLDRENFHSEATASKLLYEVDKVYKDPAGGYRKALDTARDILTNPGYKLSEQQREQYYHKAVGEIHTNEAIRKQDLGEARAAYNELTLQSATGRPVDSDQVEQVAKAFEAAGDPGGRARVYSAFIRKPLNDDFGKQPLSAQTQQLTALQGANAATAAHRFFIGKGYTPEQSAGIVGNLVHESGLNPTAAGDGGTSGGLAQFHNERLSALRAFAAERGKPATDFQTQLEFIDKELNSTEGATRAKLLAAKTPEQAAAAFIDYERPKGWTPDNPAAGLGYESRRAFARTVFDGQPPVTDKSMGVAGSAWLAANRQSTVDDAATKQWQTVMKDYNSEGARPSLQTVNDVINAARATRNATLLDQVAHDSARMDLARDASRASLPQQSAAISTMQSAGAVGELSPGHAALLKDMQRRRDAITSGLAENPISTAAANFPDQIKPPPPLDFSTDEKLAGSLKTRGQIAQFAALKWEVPPVSALDAADVRQVLGVLASPDPAVKVRIFNAISTLPEDVRSATLAKLGDKDPTAAVEVFAGSLLKEVPEVAASILTGLQTTDERFVPSKGQNKVAYMAAKDTALPVAAFNIAARTNPTGAFAVLSQAMDARYTTLSAQAGDTTGVPNRTRLKQAADDVTGGILYHGGAPIIAPERGMSQSNFDGVMAGITDADVAGMVTGKGTPITAEYLRNSSKLHSLSTGRYLVQVNADDANPRYAAGPGGKPFVLDLRNRPQATIASASATSELALP